MEEKSINSEEELLNVQDELVRSNSSFLKLGLNQISGSKDISTHQEAERLIEEAKKPKGTICSCCGQKVKLYKRNLKPNMVLALRIMFDFYNARYYGEDSEHLPYHSISEIFENIEPEQRKALLNDFTKLKYWDLIAPMPTRPDKVVYKKNWFTITTQGIKFVLLEIGLPLSVFVYNDSVDSHGNKFVTLQEVLESVGINYLEIYGKEDN